MKRLLGSTMLAAALALLSGCGDADDLDAGLDAGFDAGLDASFDAAFDAGPGLPCSADGASTLSGVSIEFPEQQCSFTLAEAASGISIAHQLVVAADLADVTTEPQDAGGCARPRPGGLTVHEVLTAGTERYCICDEGRCPGTPMLVSLVAGTHDDAFRWEGRNWDGPSDTGMPMGAPFPPGSYELRVSAVGEHAGARFEVEGTFTIHLVE